MPLLDKYLLTYVDIFCFLQNNLLSDVLWQFHRIEGYVVVFSINSTGILCADKKITDNLLLSLAGPAATRLPSMHVSI